MRILSTWTENSLEVFTRGEKHNPGLVGYMVYSQQVASILAQSLLLTVPCAGQEPQSLLSTTGDAPFDELLNSMKGKSLELADSLVDYIHSSPYSTKMNTLPMLAYCTNSGPRALVSLAVVCVKEYDKLEERINDREICTFLAGLMRLLSTLLDDNNFYIMFSPNKQSIIVDIVLVMLRSSSKEIKSMSTDPENFVNLAIDACEKQESETCKTEAAKLLEALCDHVDGCLSFTSIFCCEAIKYACKKEPVTALAGYPLLSQFSNRSMFLLRSSPELIAETSILVMADISYLTPKRKDIL